VNSLSGNVCELNIKAILFNEVGSMLKPLLRFFIAASVRCSDLERGFRPEVFLIIYHLKSSSRVCKCLRALSVLARLGNVSSVALWVERSR